VRILHRAVHHEQAIEREVNPYKLWYVNNLAAAPDRFPDKPSLLVG
jgi:hypothetical protein